MSYYAFDNRQSLYSCSLQCPGCQSLLRYYTLAFKHLCDLPPQRRDLQQAFPRKPNQGGIGPEGIFKHFKFTVIQNANTRQLYYVPASSGISVPESTARTIPSWTYQPALVYGQTYLWKDGEDWRLQPRPAMSTAVATAAPVAQAGPSGGKRNLPPPLPAAQPARPARTVTPVPAPNVADPPPEGYYAGYYASPYGGALPPPEPRRPMSMSKRSLDRIKETLLNNPR